MPPRASFDAQEGNFLTLCARLDASFLTPSARGDQTGTSLVLA